jgi:hypothetical protein
MVQEDTSIKIWEWLFRVSIPYLQSRTMEDLKRYGVTLTGIQEYDEAVNEEWITTAISIVRMVELYKEGVPIRVLDVKDTKTIYEYISLHIQAWKVRLERGINLGDAPIDDLIDMDQFASVVYAEAKYQFTREYADSFTANHLSGLQRFNANTFFNKTFTDSINKVTVDQHGVTRINAAEEIQDRDSLSEFFKNRIINNRH